MNSLRDPPLIAMPPDPHHQRHRTVSFSYPHAQIERQIDTFLETFKRRSAAAMERAQSLQGGPGGLVAQQHFETPVFDTSPSRYRKDNTKPPRRKVRWTWNTGVSRSRSGMSVESSESGSSAGSYDEPIHRSLPHSLGDLAYDSQEDLSGMLIFYSKRKFKVETIGIFVHL